MTTPTPAPEKDTAMNLPRVVKFADIKIGQKIERTRTSEDDTELISRGVVTEKGDTYAWSLTNGLAWSSDDADPDVTIRVLEEPPAPALPTVAGTVIDCTLDGEPGAVLVQDKNGDWTGVDAIGVYTTVYAQEMHPDRVANWTVVYDPTAKPGAES